MTKSERERHLDERKLFYSTLNDAALEAEWSAREKHNLESDEVDVLRVLLRDRKGIVGLGYGHGQRVCRQCGMVESNCTCERSWF